MYPLSSYRPVRAFLSRYGFLKRSLILVHLLFFLVAGSFAQAPTSLQYPASSGFIANVTNVYIVPTLAGSTASLSYAVSPALPAGLSFNTGTGVISGVPTAASSATTYTVTATNASGSTTKSFSITVSNSYFDNAYGQVSFLDANRTFKVGNGQATGDVALYANAATISGQAIDCIVKTVSVTNVSSWSSYDQPLATDNSTFNSNDDKFFSPQVVFGTGGGNIVFEFQFIISGSYNAGTNTGTNVTLQNVLLNTYDIDGNGGANSNQYNEFEGFSKSELGSGSTISAPAYDATLGLTKYLSSISTNNLTVTSDATRVRLTYDNMSVFRIQVGAGATGAAYFFLDFSSGPAFSTATASYPPTIDLNTAMTGAGNGAFGCASALTFSKSAQTNVASATALNELSVTYLNTAANLPDGASEQLLINGATAGTASHALNFSTGSTSSVTVGGVAYTITKSVSGTTNTVSFTNGSTFTLAQAESLLDALQYNNSAGSPTSGDRAFTVNVRSTQFISPDAAFTATLNCLAITGNIYHDANGLTDNTVNGNGTMGQFAVAGAYAVLTNSSTNAVLSTVPIAAGGAFTFGRQGAGAYNIFISNTSSPGTSLSASTFPAGGYKSVGENLGSAAGNDGSIDSKMTVSLGTIAVSNANFGIQIPPSAADYSSANQSNPGGYNFYTIPSGNFVTSDADGSVQSITVTSFPTGANYLKYGSTIYTSGGTCPPQSSCTTWPGTLVVPIASIGTLSVDPASAGNTSVTLQYTALDNGGLHSNNNTPNTITLPFVVPATPISISGTVWNDANGNGTKDAGEGFSAAASSGQTLYALLIQTTNTYSGLPTIYTATAVSATTGYAFSNVPAGSDYEVRIVSLAAAPSDGAAKSTVTACLATGYAGVSTNNNGTIASAQNTVDLVNALATVSADKTAVGFGIERTPDTYVTSATITHPAVNSLVTLSGGGNPAVFTGSDPEDQPSNATLSGKTVAITALPVKGQLWYNNTQITKGVDNTNVPSLSNPFKISSFDPAKMQVKFTGTGYTALTFSYAYVDAAGMIDPTPATYTLSWSTALPVRLLSFTGKLSGAMANLAWTSADEVNFKEYALERSADGVSFTAVATVAAKGGAVNEYRYADDVSKLASAKVYYRLQQTDNDGKATYSSVVSISLRQASGLTLNVTPNPVKSAATLTISSENSGSGILAITDYSGKTVLTKTVGVTAGTTVVQLENDKQLPNGMYVVSVEMNGEVKTQRFVVQR